MPLTVSHVLSATTPDDPAYEIRPSHWNSAHAFTLNASGSEISGAFSNAGNVTFGLETNGFITASANAAGAGDGFNRLAAGTQTAGTNNTIVFANSNGVTFGMSGSTQITASHNGITQQSTQPVAFSAGAASSNFSTLVFQDSNGVSWSNNAGSIRASVRTDYLTTAAQSNQVVNSLNGSTGQISLNVGSSLSASTNGSSITFGLASNITTALQSAGAYLTTARASNDAIGLNSAFTAGPLAMTINSSGLSLNAGSAAGTTSGFAGNLISGSMTHNTAGLNLSLNHPAWLTTARASNDAIGLNSAVSNVTATINSSGLSLDARGYAGTGTTLAGANVSFSATLNSNGLNLSGSVAPGGGAGFTGGVSNLGNTSGNTGTQTGSFVLAGGNNITLSVATAAGGHQTITISGANVAAGNITVSAGTTSGGLGAITFNDSNGVSFGLNAGVITATVKTDYQSSNANYLTSQSNQAFSASGGSSAFQTLNFANSNGATFTNTNGSVALSYTVPTVTQYFSATNTTFNGTNVSGSMTLNTNGLRIDLSGPAPGAGAINISAGTTSNNLQTVVFSNSNGVSFGLNGSTITASAAGGAGDGFNILAAGTQTAGTNTTIAFVNSNGVTFGMSGSSQITASHNGITQQSTQPVAASAGNGSVAFSTLSFSNANGISFSTAAGPAIIASHNGLTSQSNQAFSASGGSSAFQTLNFANSNGATFTNTNGSVAISYTVPTVTQYFSATNTTFNGTNVSGSITLNTNGLRIDLSAPAPGAGAAVTVSASNGSFTVGQLNFSNANNVTFGTSAGSIVTASVAAPGAAAENNWFALSGNTSGNTTASGSTINLSGINLTLSGTNGSQIAISAPATSSLVGTNGISLSTNGSTISVSYVPDIISRYINEPSITQVGNAAANSLVSIVPVFIPDNLAVSNVRFGLSANVGTAGNNSSGFNNNSVSLVFYTRNGSTLSSFNSASNTYTASWSSNATGSVVGPRGLTVDLATATTLTAGEYWVAVHVSSNNTGPGANTTALGGTYSMLVGASAGSAALGLDPWAAATAATRGASIGLGAISTGATRGTIAISDITQTGTRAMAAKLWMDFRNYSVW